MSTLSRRSFLVTGLLGATLAATSRNVAVAETNPFTDAAERYDVPADLLAAVSYGHSRWADHAGRPSHSNGYGPMHLIDGAAVSAMRRGEGTGAPTVDTLADAARLTGIPAQQLRTDPAANIRGGAALLADAQRRAKAGTGRSTDPATRFAAVAASSGTTEPAAQLAFADAVMADLRRGASVREAGITYSLSARPVADPGQQRSRLLAHVRSVSGNDGPVDAPAGLDVEWVPAPYVQYGPDPGDYGNHALAFRPRSPRLTHIVVHDTECSYDTALKLVQDPSYLAWNYTVRSADGHIAQHLQTKDIGWHAGNWWFNMHAVGIEHEGFAPQGYTWFTESAYRASARLVRHLCRTYDIPMDRGHIIGHDQVPGVDTAHIAGMHWDPGPFWDWEHYFELMGAPLIKGTTGQSVVPGDVVRILPGFDDNAQDVTGCSGVCVEGTGHGTNFVPLRTRPDQDPPLVTDPGRSPSPSTTQVSDMGARAAAGTDYVVAELADDWTAVWYLGAKAWFHNPKSPPTARRVKKRRTVTPKSTTARTFGRAYPEPTAYPAGIQPQPITPLIYTIPPRPGVRAAGRRRTDRLLQREDVRAGHPG